MMELEYAKNELVKRYRYLYENASLVLVPFVQQSLDDKIKKRYKKAESIFDSLVYLNLDQYDVIIDLVEKFLLGDQMMEESTLYQLIEDCKMDSERLNKIRDEVVLAITENKIHKYFRKSIDIWDVLSFVGEYIEEQSGDLKNKNNKLAILDEYYKLLRYQNDGVVRMSGRKLDIRDGVFTAFPLQQHVHFRKKEDIGVVKNAFIHTLANAPHYDDNDSIFMEQEKQDVYLSFHDELPWDLYITCELEKAFSDFADTRLHRPLHTKPCGKSFYVKEKEIFVDPEGQYYQICPYCGWLVSIPREILSKGIELRILERVRQDENLFRKMYLYSELFSLDREATEGQKKLLR